MPDLTLYLGVKTDPVEYRYSYEWLFRLMAEEGVAHAQIGSFFEMYWLPDEFFHDLRQQAQRFGVRISSVFTTHRELGGLFRPEPGFHEVAVRSLRRMIEIGALLGADSVGGSAGAVLRDRMADKAPGTRRFLDAMKSLLPYAYRLGIPAVTVEPMSCLAEPPTTPDEIVAWAEDVNTYRRRNPDRTAGFGYCVDIAHGYHRWGRPSGFDNLRFSGATLPYLHYIHLKNTDAHFDAPLGSPQASGSAGSSRWRCSAISCWRTPISSRSTKWSAIWRSLVPSWGAIIPTASWRGCSASRCATCAETFRSAIETYGDRSNE